MFDPEPDFDAAIKAPEPTRLERWAPTVVVAGWVALSLWSLRATLKPAVFVDDSSVHEQMVRFATQAFKHGRDPLTSWWPYLNLGSPQFLHYQSLGAMVTGLAGVVVGANTAFRWSQWLLLGAAWPVSVYISARILRMRPWTAVAAGVISSVIASVPSVGLEDGAYVWYGYGLWTQLWGMIFLPLSWAAIWRAMDDRRWVAPAAVLTSVTLAFHYETGFVAALGIIVMPWLTSHDFRGRLRHAGQVRGGYGRLASLWVLVRPSRDLAGRLRRAAHVLVGFFLMGSAVLVPLAVYAKWAAINETLKGTGDENGYGAHKNLGWLFTGGIFDHGNFPVITILVFLGIAVVVLGAVAGGRWVGRSFYFPLLTGAYGRALLTMGLLTLLLTFGRTTWGPLVDIVPASHDVFFRRFLMGPQLAGIFLAAIGLSFIGRGVSFPIRSLGEGTDVPGWFVRGAGAILAGLLCGVVLLPPIFRSHDFDNTNQAGITQADSSQVPGEQELKPIIAYIRAHPGRTYAGEANSWATNFRVGETPVFKYLENEDIEEVGYTLRTAALMSTPEAHFDEFLPSEYTAFGIKYVIFPSDHPGPPGGQIIMNTTSYVLYEMPQNGYFNVVDTVGSVRADRGHLDGVDANGLVQPHADDTVAWDHGKAAAPTSPGRRAPASPPGNVVSSNADLVASKASATVNLTRKAVVMLSVSYDPGWKVTVDGHSSKTEMLAPALLGVTVGPGTHHVSFTYHGFEYYPLLILVALLGLAGTVFVSVGGFGRFADGP